MIISFYKNRSPKLCKLIMCTPDTFIICFSQASHPVRIMKQHLEPFMKVIYETANRLDDVM